MKIIPQNSIDFYKSGHADQYPSGTTKIYSNFTPRSSAHAKVSTLYDDKVVWFGLQGFIQRFLIDLWNEEFFSKPKVQVAAAYKRRMDNALGVDAVMTSRIEALHDLGFLPLRIKALPEGSRVNIKVPLFTITNTHPDFYWLTNYIETVASSEVWKPTTVATISFEYRRVLNSFIELTGSSKEFADWQCHDFSMRGMSGVNDAASSSAGHLLSNFGTDCVPAIDYLEDYYFANSDQEMIGGSVPATEHSVMCSGGADDELGTIRRLISDIYPSGVVSVVSDTWDFWNVITVTANTLKDDILNRKPNSLGRARVVFRPDSGDPADIICGTANVVNLNDYDSLHLAKSGFADSLRYQEQADTPHGVCGNSEVSGYFQFSGDIYKMTIEISWNRYDKQYYYQDGHDIKSCDIVILTPSEKGAVECLWEIFGGEITSKGYKTLHERVGLIYGDSITLDRQYDILSRLEKKGFSAGNVVFGIGSFTYQMITRDTFGMAMKATYAVVNGDGRELFKDPKTDVGGVKKSAKGLLRVEKEGDNFVLYDQQTELQEQLGALETVFLDGIAYNTLSLPRIRKNLENSNS